MSKAAKNKQSATYEDVLNLPDDVIGEIVDGELFVSPRPSAKHAIASSRLLSEIDGPFHSGKGGGPGGWWIIMEPELHIIDQILVPDLAGWRKERMEKIPDAPHFDIVPDWVCEVLSPSNLQLDRVKKVPKYAQCGVAYLWIVDPIARSLEVMRLEKQKWLLIQTFAGNEKFRAEPFEAMEFDLSSLWGE